MSWPKGIAYGLGIVAAGYLTMRLTTPTSGQLYNALSPELKQEADKARKEHVEYQKELKALLQKNMDSDHLVWQVEPLKAPPPSESRRDQ
ncbi:hypothetical protein IWQ60_001490 [Tieghemiomyces parasiticus]|uniref:Cytochrome b mRNA-processing protein 4 n=1 Tax=Tieghemiomyces parasiticus TaxID=78921 RepID=A0A9W7ZRL9_9FUNG|nr:hypothetical protein IWQ60_010956 [Tieghemiomyces parasiticus]KAJ1929089.1 hypothetical protein IWQ60_001490 [Tieghemiomyces parasiticus]